MSSNWGRMSGLRSVRLAGIGTSLVTVGNLHGRYVHRERPFANGSLPLSEKLFANASLRCTYFGCNHNDNPEAPVKHEPTDFNEPTTRHRSSYVNEVVTRLGL